MNKIKMYCLCLICAGIFARNTLHAGIHTGVDTGYAFDKDDSMSLTGSFFRPYLDLEGEQAGFSINAKYEWNDYSEICYSLYAISGIENFRLSAGIKKYVFPSDDLETHEIFAEAFYDRGMGLYGGVTFSYDIDEYTDFYFTFQTGYVFAVGELFNVVLGASAMVTGDFDAYEESLEMYDIEIEFKIEYLYSDMLMFNFGVEYQRTLDQDILIEPEPEWLLVAGIHASF